MSTPTRSNGFTLIEVIVVMSIITILLGMGIPGIINAQRRADRYATQNIFDTVHNACVSNAKQFGSGGSVYGFTLEYTVNSASAINGQYSAIAIKPWVILPNGATVIYNTTAPAGRIQADIGKEMIWNGDAIEFVDILLPSKTIIVDGAAPTTLTNQYLHIAYEPRTGFPHRLISGSATPTVGILNALAITASANAPNQIEIIIWRKTTGSQQPVTKFIIQPTGASDVRMAN